MSEDLFWGAKYYGTPPGPGWRKTTVAPERECSGCNNAKELEPIRCGECESEMILCPDCIKEDYCPSCASVELVETQSLSDAISEAFTSSKSKSVPTEKSLSRRKSQRKSESASTT